MNGLNILSDLWFVLGLGWGVQGVAIVTLIAEWTGFARGLLLCRDGLGLPALRNRAMMPHPGQMRRMGAVNTDIVIRSVLLPDDRFPPDQTRITPRSLPRSRGGRDGRRNGSLKTDADDRRVRSLPTPHTSCFRFAS